MSETSYFKTKKDEYVFALMMMDGECRSNFLGIRKSLYYLRYKADEWYNNIMSVLNNDSVETDFQPEQVESARAKLQSLYDDMVEG